MTKNFEDMLYLLVCAAKNIAPNDNKEYDLTSIYHLARIQGVWDTVFIAIKKMLKRTPAILDDKIYEQFNNEFIATYGRQYVRYEVVHKVINKLNDIGADCCVLKGECVSQYYNEPYARVSGDVDILIKKEVKEQCVKLLLKEGFIYCKAKDESHHLSFRHAKVGLLELHTELFDFKTKEISLNNTCYFDEKYVSFTAQDGTSLNMLGYTDNFIFLFMHFMKHFLHGGIGIRHLLDVLLYTENNHSNIDWNRVNDLLDKLSFRCFFLHLIAIGERYFEFPKKLFDTSTMKDELIEKILTDIEKGGMWGRNENARSGFISVFLQKRYEKLHPESKEKIKVDGKRKLFPNREFMSINYKYVNRSVLLMPVAWVHRVWDVLLRRKKSKPLHNERLELLRELDII